MQRVLTIGCSGAGKTTLATALHDITGLELIHLDRQYYRAGWVPCEKQEWERRVIQLAAQERWIMDGNYGGTFDVRMARANTVIFLDRSRWRCLYRVLLRTLRGYGRTRTDMAQGCRERFDWHFLQYIYHYNRSRKPKILQRLRALPPDKEVIILNSNAGVEGFLRSVKQRVGTNNDCACD